jgi:hypothetical protein
MLHLTKLAVGIRDAAHLQAVQAKRRTPAGALYHYTRQTPRRAAELLDGGSIYWVIMGAMLVRQRLVAIEAATREDDTPCTALGLDPSLIHVAPRTVRPFQGWRYLPPTDAPADLASAPASIDGDMPSDMVRALHSLALL